MNSLRAADESRGMMLIALDLQSSVLFMVWLLDILTDGVRACNRVVRDIYLAHEANARVRLRILYEILEHSHTSGPACDTVVGADRHHATAMRAFFVQDVELTFQVGCVGFGAEVARLVVHNVVHVQGVRHYDKGLVSNVHKEWLVAADIVDVVRIAELLQDL